MSDENIFANRELDEKRTYKKFLLVRTEGNCQVAKIRKVLIAFYQH